MWPSKTTLRLLTSFIQNERVYEKFMEYTRYFDKAIAFTARSSCDIKNVQDFSL